MIELRIKQVSAIVVAIGAIGLIVYIIIGLGRLA